jgi:hypothetical protein
MKPLEYYAEAETEVEDALTASAAMSPRVAAEFRGAVDQVLHDIRSGLLAGATYPRTECREYPLTRFPYSIVHLDDPDAIRVVAFAHHKRRRGYWKSRLPRS